MNKSKKKPLPPPNHRQIQHPKLAETVRTERWQEVEIEAQKILRLQSKDFFALKALGCSLVQQGRGGEAISILERARQLNGMDSEIFNNLGIARLYAAQWEAAIEQFKKALSLKPKDYVIWKNLGRCYLRVHRARDAIEALAKAIEFHPSDYHEAVSLLAQALEMAGMVEQALTALQELWRNGWKTKSVLSELIYVSLRLSDWQSFDGLLSEFRSWGEFEGEHASAPLHSLAFPGTTWNEHYQIACGYASGSLAASGLQQVTQSVQKNELKKLRVGYFSGDFRAHPVGYLIPQVIEIHDRQHFEIIGYSVGADDKSDIRKRISNAFDRFIDLGQLASKQAVEMIRADELDILVNLQGWTNDYASELFAERAAPIQISWLGYAGTMGHPVLADYLIGDPIATPLVQAPNFTETLALLDCCYLPMDTSPGAPTPIDRKEVALPEDRFVFCSFNNRYKINPQLFGLWCEILRQCPDSILWLSAAGATADNNLIRQFKERGLDPERLFFAPRVSTIGEHRRRIGAADLALDTNPYNSHSSGLDMLWAGVPMITQLGKTFADRVGASLLHHSGLTELITNSPEGYRDLAIALYQHRPRLQELRARLENGRDSALLWDTAHLVNSLEKIYRMAFQNAYEGKRTPIVIQPSNPIG